MNTLTALSVTQVNEETYNKLLVSLEAGLGMLQIFIAVCDNDRQREDIIANYERELASIVQTYRVYLDSQEPSLRLAIFQQVTVRENAISTVTGAEGLGLSDQGQSLEKFFGYLQWTREGLREFKMPIVLWIPSRIFAQLPKKSPDFYSWRNGIFQFQPEPSLFTSEPLWDKTMEFFEGNESGSVLSIEQLESSLANAINRWGADSLNLELLYSQLGNLYADRVKSRKSADHWQEFTLAEDYLNKAIALQTQFKQEESLARSLNALALLYKSQGKYNEAEILYLRSLSMREKQLGENHPDVAESLNNLANLYKCQGKYNEAEILYLRSLSMREKQLGENHPDVAISLNNLANLYYYQGKYYEAEPLCLRSLYIWANQLGENHPNVASSLNNLAILYDSQGNYEEAEPLYLRSLEINKRIYGKDHFKIARVLNNLAILYSDKNEIAIAEQEYQEALEIYRKLAVENPRYFLPDVAMTLNNLAILHQHKNERLIAEQEYEEALQIYRELAVENPRSFLPNVAMTLLNLSLFYSQFQLEKSLILAQEVIEIAQQFPELPTVQQYAETARAVLQAISK